MPLSQSTHHSALPRDFHSVASILPSSLPPLSLPPSLPPSLLPSNPKQTQATSTCFMAALPSSSFHGSWANSFTGEHRATLARSIPLSVRVQGRPLRSSPTMGNVNEGKGLFAPAVVFARNIIGRKRFNQLRGKAIALHSQIITEFCKTIGADGKQRQGLIRLAKKNGEKLGFLA